jgi:predicted HTH domain antitoxin
MNETVFEIQVPTPLLHYGIDQEEVQRRASEWLVISLFTEQRVSSGKAARLLSISRIEFLRLLRTYHIAYIDFTEQEMAEELAAATALPAEANA